MTILYYEVPRLAGARIGRSLEFGLEYAVRMLSETIAASGIDSSGVWYCEVIR